MKPRRALRDGTLSVVLMLAAVACSAAVPTPIAVPPGKGSFVFDDERGDPSRHMTVYTYLPAGVDAETARIVFVLHGISKDADTYRDVWIEPAEHAGFIVIAPLFDADQWSDGDYSHPSVADRDGTPRDPSRWSFSVVEHLFDAVRESAPQPDTAVRTCTAIRKARNSCIDSCCCCPMRATARRSRPTRAGT